MSGKIRLLIAEDSEAMRAALQALISIDPRIEIIGSACDGLEAVSLAKSLKPDVMTMDVMMPHIDGVEATARIMADSPVRILMVSSFADNVQVDLSFRAMSAGALEIIAKPTTSKPEELRAWGRRICDAIVLMAEVPVITRRRRATTRSTGRFVDTVGLVASTGGPPALASILGALPAKLPIPLFVAQHIANGFAAGLVRWLKQVSKVEVVIAVDGAQPRPGHVYMPPDECDLEVGPDFLIRTPKSDGKHSPSGDRLLASLAKAYARRACGIVLTGMGEDGAEGLRAIRDAGGVTFVQSPESCVVPGMPQAALANAAAVEVRSLGTIATEIEELSGFRR